MQPIQVKSLRERVTNILRTAIVIGELKPGQELVSTELANQIGVSQATLRDAIYILSVEGLVDTVAYHVPIVKKLSKKNIEDLFSVRNMLEVFAIQQVILTKQTSTTVQELYKICKEMEKAAEQDSLKGVNDSDNKFHNALIKHSSNQLLEVIWNMVALRVQQVMSLRNQKIGDLTQIVQNHLEITQVIESEDIEKATELISAHVIFVADVIADNWDEENIEQNSD